MNFIIKKLPLTLFATFLLVALSMPAVAQQGSVEEARLKYAEKKEEIKKTIREGKLIIKLAKEKIGETNDKLKRAYMDKKISLEEVKESMGKNEQIEQKIAALQRKVIAANQKELKKEQAAAAQKKEKEQAEEQKQEQKQEQK